jgi:putative heme transporter
MTAIEATYVADVAVIDNPVVDVCRVRERSETSTGRNLATVALVLVLATALWTQRSLISGAVAQMGSMSIAGLALLVVLATHERWARAAIVRGLLGKPVTLGQAVTIHDVGTAVSKGVPLGGALGTAVRWSIVREHGVASTRFATMLIAYGIATTFVSWLLPFAALSVDLTQRSADTTDILILAGIAAVVAASAAFWMFVLRSERLEGCATRRLRAVWARLAKRIPQLDAHDPAANVAEVRRELCSIARRPWSLLARSVGAQLGSAVILLVALRSVGVADELGVTEFFRVFFVTHLLGTFAPTPGGVGVVEAGMTGALAAAGVDTTAALAGVLVFRFLTYVLPIVFGAVLYLAWRSRRSGVTAESGDTARGGRVRIGAMSSATLAVNGPPLDSILPYFPRSSDQGFREPRHAR